MKPTLYTIDGCNRCFQARTHLIKEGIEFREINILHRPSAAKELKKRVGEVIAPVFIYEHEVVRELDILKWSNSNE